VQKDLANFNGFAPGVLYARVPVPAMPAAPVAGRGLRVVDAAAGERYADPAIAAVAPYVDAAWYAATYRDVAEAGLDPIRHYATAGWREGRRPAPGFDPAWYRDAYADIRTADLEPLRHFVAAGQREGRLPVRPADRMRAVLEKTVRDAAPAPQNMAPPDAPTLTAFAVRRLITEAARLAFGFVLSVSHDRYTDVTGGVQLVIGDEQALFACARFAYLHISPVMRAYTLAAAGGASPLLQLVLDGRFVGLAAAGDLREALAAEADALPARRLFVVHSFFGHWIGDLISYAAAMGAQHRFLWLHDFGAICEGFNLLRDGLAFCGAPPAESTACRVCVHGARRTEYRRSVRSLFTTLQPTLVAPSESALAVFTQHADLPIQGAVVHPHAALTADAPVPTPRPQIGTAADPIRVAFVGYPLPHKGWPAFLRLADDLAADPGFHLSHFAAAETLVPRHGVTSVPVQVTARHRGAMIEALRAHAIDLVLLLSPWPETFSFVTMEAIAAGADVVTLAISGNAAATVRRLGRGIVLENEAALRDFFAGGAARGYMRQVAREGRQYGALRPIGTTATLDPAGSTPFRLDPPMTREPRLTVVAGQHRLAVTRSGADYAVTLPEGTEAVRLLSRRSLAGHGVRVMLIALDGRDVPLDDAALRAGWRAAAADGRLTDGDATLQTGGASRLQIRLRLDVNYPHLPLDAD
jgi:glycosyltransferase involved in cell wall biosynthesis